MKVDKLLKTLCSSVYSVVLFFLLSTFVFAQNPEAVIKEVTGTVELQFPGTTTWVPAKPGSKITMKTIISTGIKSSVIITTESITLTIRPLTQLSLETLIKKNETDTIDIELRTGRIKADVSAPTGARAELTVRSPMTTASVRGTNFHFDSLSLRVNEGTVRFESSAKAGSRPVLVNAGQSAWLEIETGYVVNPLYVAEIRRALPSLPGQNKLKKSGTSAGFTSFNGSLDIEVNPVTRE